MKFNLSYLIEYNCFCNNYVQLLQLVLAFPFKVTVAIRLLEKRRCLARFCLVACFVNAAQLQIEHGWSNKGFLKQ